jgi:hypothetical protein
MAAYDYRKDRGKIVDPPRCAAISSTDGVPTVDQLRGDVGIVGHHPVVTRFKRWNDTFGGRKERKKGRS